MGRRRTGFFPVQESDAQDTLKDFNPVDDTILLSQTAFSALSPGELSQAAFRIGAVATDANQRIIYDSATGQLYYDRDGNGTIAPVEVGKLPGGLAMTAADFFVA